MCNKKSELRQRIRRAIEGEGATIVSFTVTGNKHGRFDFVISGRPGFIFFPGTPKRGMDLNAISGARRIVRRIKGGER